MQHIHDLSPDLGRMVDLLVTDVVVVNSRSDGGGSANTLPGLVVMSPGGWEGEPLDFDHITRCISSPDWAGFVPAVTV
ncbi:hypothetical protein JK364_08690 [Streptomyces sp. 110]|uniref:Uncharacterized protein n=1 Tax=Streptomyces endocoffeicus TaxID=2898945 RepID=A0ABS1PKC9_9ACTN|nr:hypothetical protein [Streptomyces endocoffeicus]MBL1112477.1 hypothetical protein [Streptomyces endocoffeicus]